MDMSMEVYRGVRGYLCECVCVGVSMEVCGGVRMCVCECVSMGVCGYV